MKNSLPEGHGLSDQVTSTAELLPRQAANPAITDVQYAALDGGVARGDSVLVSAPTSTGKTLIGWWAAASALEAGRKVVYLVSHRALARQKFEEVESLFLAKWLLSDQSSLVCATGDGVEDASGRKNSSPLAASVLIATYEKYLALLTAGGPPQDLTDTVLICDEVQLIGDGSRGKHVELLLTVLKQCGWHQLVALSAVMDATSAEEFCSWLGLNLIRITSREKEIEVECRSPQQTLTMRAGLAGYEEPVLSAARNSVDIHKIVSELIAKPNRSPVIVFCMKVDDTYDLCSAWAAASNITPNPIPPTTQDIDSTLLNYISKRCAFHNSELSESERKYVEDAIRNGDVDVVFATTTLAAGVNFPLGSAVFYKWKRWNKEKRVHEPIGRAEFQNMAGRVGRMGQNAFEGHVIAVAENALDLRTLQKLADLSREERLGKGISPNDFGSLVLQLFAGKLCESREEAFELLAGTLSALREAAAGRGNVDHWRKHVDHQVDRLIDSHCLIEVGDRLVLTPFGAAVARSGLKPETILFFMVGLASGYENLRTLLPDPSGSTTDDDLLFVLSHAALVSPEFDKTGAPAQRDINWRFSNNNTPVQNGQARRLDAFLFERPWVANPAAANASVVLSRWAAGAPRTELEGMIAKVRLGLIQAVARDVSWLLSAVGEVIHSVTSPAIAPEAKPPILRGSGDAIDFVRQAARIMQRLAARVSSGLPAIALWMLELELKGPNRRLTRSQILSLLSVGIERPHQLMDGSAEVDARRLQALPAVGGSSPANLARAAARSWKIDERMYFRTKHLKKADELSNRALVSACYDTKGKDLEVAIREMLSDVGIAFHELDDGKHPGFPDARMEFPNTALKPIIAEVKSKQNEHDFVALNDVTEVVTAALVAGYPGSPCLTICSPAVEPSVPSAISALSHLSVVELVDLVEAVLRLKEGNISADDLYNWLTSPGLCLRDDLPFSNV